MKPTFRNWTILMVCVLVLILLMAVPLTRSIVLWILPLGRGVDDLVFLVLLFAAGVLLIFRYLPVRQKLQKFTKWLSK